MSSKLLCVFTAAMLLATEAFGAASYPAHRGDSPWNFSDFGEPSSTYVVNDAEGLTDTYLYRYNGRIRIDIRVRRYAGKTNGGGQLVNIPALISKGLISSTFTLRLPAYDVDAGVTPIFDCDGDDINDTLFEEVDEVYFNGEKIGVLEGEDAAWNAQEWVLDIAKLKFPDNPGGVAINTLEIAIDTANEFAPLSTGAIGCNVWATAIDWAAISYKAADPVVMVHGIRSEGVAFSNFVAALDTHYIVNDNSITLTDVSAPDSIPAGCASSDYNNSTKHNVKQLRIKFKDIAELYGVESINIVGHSKGGIDSRALLHDTESTPLVIEVGTMGGEAIKHDLRANSLITLNTPHRGSILADLGVEARQYSAWQFAQSDLYPNLSKLFEGPYYCDLTTDRANAAMVDTRLPAGVQSASVATDADHNDNGIIDAGDGSGFPGGNPIAGLLYKLVGNTASVEISVIEINWLPDLIIVETTSYRNQQENDLIVTKASADEYTTYDIDNAHHMNVHTWVVGDRIAKNSLQPGLVNWRIE